MREFAVRAPVRQGGHADGRAALRRRVEERVSSSRRSAAADDGRELPRRNLPKTVLPSGLDGDRRGFRNPTVSISRPARSLRGWGRGPPEEVRSRAAKHGVRHVVVVDEPSDRDRSGRRDGDGGAPPRCRNLLAGSRGAPPPTNAGSTVCPQRSTGRGDELVRLESRCHRWSRSTRSIALSGLRREPVRRERACGGNRDDAGPSERRIERSGRWDGRVGDGVTVLIGAVASSLPASTGGRAMPAGILAPIARVRWSAAPSLPASFCCRVASPSRSAAVAASERSGIEHPNGRATAAVERGKERARSRGRAVAFVLCLAPSEAGRRRPTG